MIDTWMDNGRTDGRTEKNVAFAHPCHEGKLCSKFGRIPSSGIGGDSVTDRRTDGRMEALIISASLFFFKKSEG